MAEIDWKGLTGVLNFDEQTLRLFDLLKTKNSKITNLNIGGVARTLHIELPSQALADLQTLLLNVVPQGFLRHSTGGWLDLNAADMCVDRRLEQKAQGHAEFHRNPEVTGNIKVPKGTILKTPTGPDGRELRFFVTEEVMIQSEADSALVPVEAEHPGSAYNVGAGYITELVTHVAGVGFVINGEDWLTREGSDTEDDESLRERCVLRWHELSQGSTKYAYQSWALSVPGVREAVILDQHPRGQGTVDVVIVGAAGAPTDALVEEVQLLVDRKKPICSDALVRAPSLRTVDIAVKVGIHPIDGDSNAIQGDCMGALNALFVTDPLYPSIRSLGVGEDMTKARIVHTLMSLQHVSNVAFVSPQEDIAVLESEMAVRGTIAVTLERLAQI